MFCTVNYIVYAVRARSGKALMDGYIPIVLLSVLVCLTIMCGRFCLSRLIEVP